MKTRKQKIGSFTMADYIKAARKGSRQAEQDLLGPGFHSTDRAHRSKKLYTRKAKHKGKEE
jgi:hypothetical protein